MSKMKIGSIAFTAILIFAVVSPAASATAIFEDDFNDGDLEGWDTYSGSYGEATTSNASPTHDSYYANITDDAWIKIKNIDTRGYKNIQLSCCIRTDCQSSTSSDGDKFQVEWRSTSGSFTSLETIEKDIGWTCKTWNLPSEAGDKNEIRIKFKMENCEATDFACVDNVLVTGTPIGGPIPEFPTIAIPAVALLGLVFVLSRRKQKE